MKGEANGPGREACLAETLKGKNRERFPVLFGLIEQDQELALTCRDSPQREQREIPGLVWEQDLITFLYIWRCISRKESPN